MREVNNSNCCTHGSNIFLNRISDYMPFYLRPDAILTGAFDLLNPPIVKFYRLIYAGPRKYDSILRFLNLTQYNGWILITVLTLIAYNVLDWFLIGRQTQGIRSHVEGFVLFLFGQGLILRRPRRLSLTIFYIFCFMYGYFAYIMCHYSVVSILTTPPKKLKDLSAVRESNIPIFLFEFNALLESPFIERMTLVKLI